MLIDQIEHSEAIAMNLIIENIKYNDGVAEQQFVRLYHFLFNEPISISPSVSRKCPVAAALRTSNVYSKRFVIYMVSIQRSGAVRVFATMLD